MSLRLQNLSGVYTGGGFAANQGRHPSWEDVAYVHGPVDIVLNEEGRLTSIEKNGALQPAQNSFDAHGLVATAAFTDSHTHALFAGSRAAEYFMRWAGLSYTEMAARGGGIVNTTQALADAGPEQWARDLTQRLERMLRGGCLCVEIKSGYASNAQAELEVLRFLKKFQQTLQLPLQIKRTFLGLHSLPKGASEPAFVESMISVLNTVRDEGLADFVDAFPDEGFFSLEQSLRFAREAKARGMGLKIHADELAPFGSAENFAALGALSVDHLQKISREGIEFLAHAPTVATMLPATSFFLGLPYAPARRLLEAGARVALATDYNPGTAPDSSMGFTLRLAASQMKMSAAEILCAATFNAAAAVGEEGQGVLAVGLPANLLLWKTSKAGQEGLEEIILAAEPPEAVFSQGRLV